MTPTDDDELTIFDDVETVETRSAVPGGVAGVAVLAVIGTGYGALAITVFVMVAWPVMDSFWRLALR